VRFRAIHEPKCTIGTRAALHELGLLASDEQGDLRGWQREQLAGGVDAKILHDLQEFRVRHDLAVALSALEQSIQALKLYPKFQAFFRARRPPTLIVWGKNDVIFPAEGARPYLRDLPDAELHLLDTGHFALEGKGDEIATLILDFLRRKLQRQ
jgi:pimeloyl-ACP methyl ester carboxylesterase